MAKVRYIRKDLEKELKLNDKTLRKMGLFGTTVENMTDEEIELEIPANRPDLLSSKGFVRAFKAFENKEVGIKIYKYKFHKDYKVTVDKSVKEIWPYTACAVVKNLKMTQEEIKELITLQEKLSATLGRNRKKAGLGVYPLDEVQFPISYEARKPKDIEFQPLGSPKSMTAEQVLQKHSVGKEYAHILNNAPRYPVFVNGNKKIMSLIPIINSEETGHVTEETTDVFIECSGKDFMTVKKMLIILTTELAERGGEVYGVQILDKSGGIEEITPSYQTTKIKIRKESIESILGLKFSDKEIETLLARMCHEYDAKAGTVKIAPWRTDILHEVDIAEDLAIAYGYENLVPSIPSVSTIGAQTIKTKYESKVREILNGLGMLELSSLHFITKEESDYVNDRKCILLENPRTEYALLRPNLMIPLLRTLAANRDTEYPQQVYELGPVFYADPESETGIEEKDQIIIGITPSNFTQAKQVLEYLARELGYIYELKEGEAENFVTGRTGHIFIQNEKAGHIGEVHPTTLRNWKLKMPLAVIELDLAFLKN